MSQLRRNMLVHIPIAHTFLFFLIFIFSSNVSTNIHACNQSERSSLLSFALTLSNSPPLNWTAVNCCHWEGITCDLDGSVTHLSLPSKEIKLKGGVFPLSISLQNLTHLTYLNLSHNLLYGSLDQTAFFLSFNNLEILDLSYNRLFGDLPFSLPFTHIRTLDLSSNHFHGAIPSSTFQQAWNLTSFNVSNNSFTGPIPSSYICLHSNPLVKRLDFSFNKFNGKISPGLGKCSNLKVFRAGHNNLSGLLPEDVYNATKLEEIALPLNSLYGTISERIANLSHLKILGLNSNKLSGVLPAGIGKLSNLQLMLLDFNSLEGSLPPSFMNCTNLIELRLAFNYLKGDITKLNFSKLSQLAKLDLGNNCLTGVVPISLYSCKFLKAIRLSDNDLEGQIQPEILSLKSLSFLSLSTNRLTNMTTAMKLFMRCRSLEFLALGSAFVDEETRADFGIVDFSGLQNLRFLDLGYCHLTGELPIWLSKLKKLGILYMDHNKITGSIPCWLGTLPMLFYMNLGSNLISGEFPKALCRLPKLVSAWTADQIDDNDLELPIYGSQGKLSVQYTFSCFAPEIYVGNNAINGSIPFEIGQLQLLHALNLCNNNFSGCIPEQISNLKNLEELDLSRNQFTGIIPSSITRLNFLSAFNVSYNNLAGSIPRGTQLQLLNASAFEGNPKLCGTPLPNECQPNNGNDNADIMTSKDNTDNEHQSQIPWFYTSTVLGFIVGFWGVCCPLVLKKKWRYGYFKFLHSAQDRLQVMIIACVYGN
ncbi:receptor-like protein 2 [Rosa rugosa]|uniref:receptor-like protein 2 n=1 Tax=Rosa rugosa TaxID=74645 RepID=UPI002B410AFE|nr:receptor-like protein 2 [Rosa rugosa]